MNRFSLLIVCCFGCKIAVGYPAPEQKELPINLDNFMGRWVLEQGSLPEFIEFAEDQKIFTGENSPFGNSTWTYRINGNRVNIKTRFGTVFSDSNYSVKSLTSEKLILFHELTGLSVYRRVKE